MVIAESESQRFSVDNLAAPEDELETFLALFFCGERDLCSHIPEDMAASLAKKLAPLLVDLTGSLMSFIVTILRKLYYDPMGCSKSLRLEKVLIRKKLLKPIPEGSTIFLNSVT